MNELEILHEKAMGEKENDDWSPYPVITSIHFSKASSL
jgi:hypothetical protein